MYENYVPRGFSCRLQIGDSSPNGRRPVVKFLFWSSYYDRPRRWGVLRHWRSNEYTANTRIIAMKQLHSNTKHTDTLYVDMGIYVLDIQRAHTR